MSRIRQIKPSWFLDKDLRRGTTADAREFYIGLWMVADDAGYLVWDVVRLGAELYPFDPITRRERNVEKWAAVLEHLDPSDPHLIVWTCGHARVPKMPAHQRIAGKQSFAVAVVHAGDEATRTPPPERCRTASSRLRLPEASDSPGIGRVGNGTERNVEERNGSASAPSPDGGAARSTFDEQMSAHGYPRPKVIA